MLADESEENTEDSMTVAGTIHRVMLTVLGFRMRRTERDTRKILTISLHKDKSKCSTSPIHLTLQANPDSHLASTISDESKYCLCI